MEKHIGKLILNRFEQYADKVMLKISEHEQWTTFTGKQASGLIQRVSCTLLQDGIEKGDRVGIYAQNMPDWTFADVGILAFGGITVPIFATQIANEAKYILKDADIQILFIGEEEQYNEVLKIIDDKDLNLRKVIVFDDEIELSHPKIIHFKDWLQQEFSEQIKAKLDFLSREITSDDLATIIYTSGTTGEPKGVMLSHSNILETLKNHDIKYDITDKDESLAFLPLAHVFERIWTFYVFHKGLCNIYNKDPKLIAHAMERAKPTIMCSVPRLYEKIYFMAKHAVEQSSKIKQWLFNTAIATGEAIEQHRIDNKKVSFGLQLKYKIMDKLVLSKIRAKMGGRLRFMPCGGAALPAEITGFFRAVGLPIVIGYGLTETTATVTSYDVDVYKLGTAGVPLPNVQVKIGENDEILVKGGGVMQGYYNKPEATAKVFTEDGWFRTGDAGFLDDDGNLVITDRIKDLIKTSGGKYVAPQLVEATLLNHNLIEQVAVVGEGKPYVSALLIPNFEALKEWAKNKEIQFNNLQDLVNQPKIIELYDSLVDSLQSQLSNFERIKKFTLMPKEFSIEDNEMTPTFKIKRKTICAKYSYLIDKMYLS